MQQATLTMSHLTPQLIMHFNSSLAMFYEKEQDKVYAQPCTLPYVKSARKNNSEYTHTEY